LRPPVSTHRRIPETQLHRTQGRSLNNDIRAWINTWNDEPKPFVWAKTADQILDSTTRYCERITDSGH
jgi:hypothetical protein